jgi:hypothetical protein
MELPVIIEPLPDQSGFAARLAAPIDLSAEGATADEAEKRLAIKLQERLVQGTQLRTLRIPSAPPPGGWLPDDELTQEWLQHIRDYRAECDERDRQELEKLTEAGEASP